MRNERYAELAKRLRKDAHSGDHYQVIQGSSGYSQLSPKETLNRIDEITERVIDNLDWYIEEAGWPDDLEPD